MPPTVSVLTPSFNKHEYVMDAVNSVLKQTLTNWDYWIIDNSTDVITRKTLQKQLPKDPRIKYYEYDFSNEIRRDYYVPAYIINQIYPLMDGYYIFYLSDDDILHQECFQRMVNVLDSNPDAWVSYHSQQRLLYKNGQWQDGGGIFTNYILGKDTVYPGVDCNLDGGQIMHRKACLEYLDYPYFPEDYKSASHCDGIFAQKLADRWKIFPVSYSEPLSIHRITPKSTWTKSS